MSSNKKNSNIKIIEKEDDKDITTKLTEQRNERQDINNKIAYEAIKNNKVEDTLIFPQPPGLSKILKRINLVTLCNLSRYDFREYKEIEK